MPVQTITSNSTKDLQRGVDHIGVCCIFFCHDGNKNIVLYKRGNACRDEQGKWDNGGGSLEFGEDFEQAVRREVKEEYCVEPIEIKFLAASNVLRKNGDQDTHWVALIFAVEVDPTQVKIGEPNKMEDLGWFSKNSLPSPLHSQLLRHAKYLEEAGLF